jgi:hypothetical protein
MKPTEMKRAVVQVADMFSSFRGHLPRTTLPAHLPAILLSQLLGPLERLTMSNTPETTTRAEMSLRAAWVRAKRAIEKAVEQGGGGGPPEDMRVCPNCNGRGAVWKAPARANERTV